MKIAHNKYFVCPAGNAVTSTLIEQGVDFSVVDRELFVTTPNDVEFYLARHPRNVCLGYGCTSQSFETIDGVETCPVCDTAQNTVGA